MGRRLGILPVGLVAGLVGLLVLSVLSACSSKTGATPETTVGRQILPEGTPVLPEAHCLVELVAPPPGHAAIPPGDPASQSQRVNSRYISQETS